MKTSTIVSAATAALFTLAALPVTAQTLGGVTFHGFVGQGYLNSPENNWLSAPTADGTFAFTEGALNFNVEPVSKLRIGAQFFAQDLGAIGNNRRWRRHREPSRQPRGHRAGLDPLRRPDGGALLDRVGVRP